MMKKLLVMLMALMMCAASGYAEKSEAEIAKESFGAMVADITGQIEASYKAQDTVILCAPDDNENKRGWVKYKYDNLVYDTKFSETGERLVPYKATLEMSFVIYNLHKQGYPVYAKSKNAADLVATSEADWEWATDDGTFNLFTYEYSNGKWNLVKSQYGYESAYEKNSGYDKILERDDWHMHYKDYSDGKLYSPFDIYLIKNYKNSPHMWH